MKDAQQTTDYLIDEFNDYALYDIATSVLYYLEKKGYCVWQTYNRDDIELNLGRKPTEDDMSALQENISNIFEQIRPEEV